MSAPPRTSATPPSPLAARHSTRRPTEISTSSAPSTPRPTSSAIWPLAPTAHPGSASRPTPAATRTRSPWVAKGALGAPRNASPAGLARERDASPPGFATSRHTSRDQTVGVIDVVFCLLLSPVWPRRRRRRRPLLDAGLGIATCGLDHLCLLAQVLELVAGLVELRLRLVERGPVCARVDAEQQLAAPASSIAMPFRNISNGSRMSSAIRGRVRLPTARPMTTIAIGPDTSRRCARA